MKIKGYKYVLLYNHNNMIINANNFKNEINEGAEVEIYDTFGIAKGFDSLKQLEKFIIQEGLIFPEEAVEINPFDKEWSPDYIDAKIRMFIDSINAMQLSIEQPEFVMLLKQKNIKLLIDEDYEGTWAYLEEIEKEHRSFLEAPKEQGGYNVKFQER